MAIAPDRISEIEILANLLNIPSSTSLSNEDGVLALKNDNGGRVQGYSSICKYLARKSGIKSILGRGREDEAIIDQWLEYRSVQIDRSLNKKEAQMNILKELDSCIACSVYFVGNQMTLADFVLFHGLYIIFRDLTFLEKQQFINLSRWFRHIQAQKDVKGISRPIEFQRNLIYTSLVAH